jgi:hypothetical protein
MPINPLAPVTDYQSMLSRIFWFTTAAAVAGIWMLRQYLPPIDRLLSDIDFTLSFAGSKALPIPGGYLLPALGVGLLTRVYRLHARVSDCLGIREAFDIHVILRELAERVGVDAEAIGDRRVLKARHDLMRKAFYPFVSGAEPQIDRQLIQQALDAWSWFWVGVEVTSLFVLVGASLAVGGELKAGFYTIGIALALAAAGLPPIYEQCRRLAVAQVRAIVEDAARASGIRSQFDKLVNSEPQIKLAA